jgi:hypothetical protein
VKPARRVEFTLKLKEPIQHAGEQREIVFYAVTGKTWDLIAKQGGEPDRLDLIAQLTGIPREILDAELSFADRTLATRAAVALVQKKHRETSEWEASSGILELEASIGILELEAEAEASEESSAE